MNKGSFMYKMSQRTDVSLRRKRDASFLCRYAAVLSPEARAYGERCQDYLTVAAADGAVRFAVCDGVGLSYRGDLAARLLGDGLLAWLAKRPPLDAAENAAALAADFRKHLDRLAEEASLRVKRSRIPKNAPELLREVLQENKRQGSEAMFVCGLWETKGQAMVFGMGDIRIRGWRDEGEDFMLLPTATEARWSTSRGLVGGMPQLWMGKAEEISGLAVYTDGLKSLDAERLPLAEANLREHLEAARNRAGGDDAALLILERQVGIWTKR